MAQIASGLRIHKEICNRTITVEKVSRSSILEDAKLVFVLPVQADEDDWRTPIIKFLKTTNAGTNIKIKRRSIHYFLNNG